jgi:hypothetical protein
MISMRSCLGFFGVVVAAVDGDDSSRSIGIAASVFALSRIDDAMMK